MSARLSMLGCVLVCYVLGWHETAGMLAWLDMIGVRVAFTRRQERAQ